MITTMKLKNIIKQNWKGTVWGCSNLKKRSVGKESL